jgi:hypothetical protein
MNCPACGASIQAGEVECSTCGETVALLDVIPSSDQLAKLGVLRELDDRDGFLRHPPAGSSWASASVAKATIGLIITIMAIVTVFLFSFLGSFLQIVLAFFCALGGTGLIVGGLSCLAQLAESPLERLSTVVMGKIESPTRIPGVHSHHLALLTSTQGKRAVRARGALIKELGKGDAGIAYVKGGFLLDFKRMFPPEA